MPDHQPHNNTTICQANITKKKKSSYFLQHYDKIQLITLTAKIFTNAED